MEQKRERVERSDRKIPVNPTIDIALYDLVSRISYVTDQPLHTVGVALCEAGLTVRAVVNGLAVYFRYPFHWTEGITLFGDKNSTGYSIDSASQKKRLMMRFRKPTNETLKHLAFALDCQKATAVGLLLDISLRSEEVLSIILSNFDVVPEQLDSKKAAQLQWVLRYTQEPCSTTDATVYGFFARILLRLGVGARTYGQK